MSNPNSCDVLIVDDDLHLADTMTKFLRRRGLDVRTAHGAESALRLVERYLPHVAVLDYHLPGANGLSLAESLRSRLPALPIILMSGAMGAVERAAVEKAGILVVVDKPVPLRVLHQAILQIIPRARPPAPTSTA